ncbi:hypothetical protein [Enterobacter cloacae]|uniref:hypothetical protein n=1 Tax=Enterobacter cloacae TaxID=550 RepID=UPI0011446939|nr:hypothetical protein [Enterobacter cloacae]
MGKYIINGFVYEVIGDVITVQPVQGFKFQFYPSGNQPCPVLAIKQYALMNYSTWAMMSYSMLH